MYDMIIIGAGPAGISASIYGKSRGKNVLVLEKKEVGGLIGTVSTAVSYTHLGWIQDRFCISPPIFCFLSADSILFQSRSICEARATAPWK